MNATKCIGDIGGSVGCSRGCTSITDAPNRDWLDQSAHLNAGNARFVASEPEEERSHTENAVIEHRKKQKEEEYIQRRDVLRCHCTFSTSEFVGFCFHW